MSLPDWIHAFLAPLEAAELPYAVTGSVASMLYGEPRFTNDVDVVIWIGRNDIERFESLYSLDEFYVPDTEFIQKACVQPGGSFNLIHLASGNKADFYLGKHGPIERWVLEHRRRVPVGDTAIWLVPPEYIIAKKLEFYREGKSPKHLRDIRGILMAKVPLDQAALERLIDDQDLWREWREASSG